MIGVGGTRMMSLAFEPMSATDRAEFRAAYLAYLRNRDGVPDLQARRFDVRERFFAELDANPTCWVGAPPVDQQRFDRNHKRRTPEPNLDDATLWALATAKANRGERYGVEYSLAHNGDRPRAATDLYAYIQVEEVYHTRILKDALAAIGLAVDVGRPGWSTRALVRTMVRLPHALADLFVLGGEIVGVALFALLLDKARQLFKSQAPVLARLEALFGQILVDEVGHVHFVRSGLDARGLAWARRLLPLIGRGVLQDLPEMVQLFGRETIMRRVLAADVDGAAAAYPDRFIPEARRRFG
jgi:hypothetical protein